MSVIIIDQFRILELPDRTIGNVLIPGLGKIFTLEDPTRPYGQKIYGETAIPFNDVGYHVGSMFSPSFDRWMINLYTEADRITLAHGGISFTNIYIHGGNKPKDTLGCILTAFNYDKTNKIIYGTAEEDIYDILSDLLRTNDILWRITKSNHWL